MLKFIIKIAKLARAGNNRMQMLNVLITFKPWFFKLYPSYYRVLPEQLNEVIISSISYADMPARTKIKLLTSLRPQSPLLKAAQLEAIDWSIDHYDLELIKQVNAYVSKVRDSHAEIACLADSILSRCESLCLP